MSMKVINNEVNGLNSKKTNRSSSAGSKGKASAKKNGGDSSSSDSVSISKTGEQMKGFRTELDKVSDVRAERIESIKSRINSGNYNPPSSEIADAMIKTIMQFG